MKTHNGPHPKAHWGKYGFRRPPRRVNRNRYAPVPLLPPFSNRHSPQRPAAANPPGQTLFELERGAAYGVGTPPFLEHPLTWVRHHYRQCSQTHDQWRRLQTIAETSKALSRRRDQQLWRDCHFQLLASAGSSIIFYVNGGTVNGGSGCHRDLQRHLYREQRCLHHQGAGTVAGVFGELTDFSTVLAAGSANFTTNGGTTKAPRRLHLVFQHHERRHATFTNNAATVVSLPLVKPPFPTSASADHGAFAQQPARPR